MIQINNTLGNPPYNGPGPGRPPIYHHITEIHNKCVKPNEEFKWIVQYNWITQLSTVGKTMRKVLLDMGVYKIEDNRFAGFTEATVRTCTIHCRTGYSGDILFYDRTTKTGRSVDRNIFLNTEFLPIYCDKELALINKIKKLSVNEMGFPKAWKTSTEKRKVYPLNGIAVTYFADFVNGGIGKMQVTGPHKAHPGSNRIFDDYKDLESKEHAEEILKRMQGFWNSALVKFILKRTLTSRTIDNPQLEYVPYVPMDREWNNELIAEYFNLTDEEKELINKKVETYEFTIAPSEIITKEIIQQVLLESKNKAIFRTKNRKDLNGEVFTPSELVLHMMLESKPSAWEDGKTFMDPTCGNGQILAAVVTIKKMLGHKNILNTVYGFDLMEDNVAECRQRLLDIVGDTPANRTLLEDNILQGDALQEDTYSKFNEEVSLFA